jgi:hypothetical protein
MLAVAGAVGLASLANTLGSWRLTEVVSGAASADRAATEAAFAALLEREGTLTSLTGLSLLAAAVSFLGWLHRAVGNVPALTGTMPRTTPWRAVLWWFVPVANLWIPYTIVRDVKERLESRLGSLRLTGILRTWWLSWVAVPVGLLSLQLAIGRLDRSVPTLATGALGEAAWAMSAVLAVLVVRRLDTAQRLLAGRSIRGSPLAGVSSAGTRAPGSWALVGLSALVTSLVAVGALVLAPAVAGTGEGAWATFRPKDGSYLIELPGSPRSADEGQLVGSGEKPTGEDDAVEEAYVLERSDHTIWVTSWRLPGAPDAEAQLEAQRQAAIDSGLTLISWRLTWRGSHRGVEWEGQATLPSEDGEPITLHVRALEVVAGDHLYSLVDARDTPTAPVELARIFDSFRPTLPRPIDPSLT